MSSGKPIETGMSAVESAATAEQEVKPFIQGGCGVLYLVQRNRVKTSCVGIGARDADVVYYG